MRGSVRQSALLVGWLRLLWVRQGDETWTGWCFRERCIALLRRLPPERSSAQPAGLPRCRLGAALTAVHQHSLPPAQASSRASSAACCPGRAPPSACSPAACACSSRPRTRASPRELGLSRLRLGWGLGQAAFRRVGAAGADCDSPSQTSTQVRCVGQLVCRDGPCRAGPGGPVGRHRGWASLLLLSLAAPAAAACFLPALPAALLSQPPPPSIRSLPPPSSRPVQRATWGTARARPPAARWWCTQTSWSTSGTRPLATSGGEPLEPLERLRWPCPRRILQLPPSSPLLASPPQSSSFLSSSFCFILAASASAPPTRAASWTTCCSTWRPPARAAAASAVRGARPAAALGVARALSCACLPAWRACRLCSLPLPAAAADQPASLNSFPPLLSSPQVQSTWATR